MGRDSRSGRDEATWKTGVAFPRRRSAKYETDETRKRAPDRARVFPGRDQKNFLAFSNQLSLVGWSASPLSLANSSRMRR